MGNLVQKDVLFTLIKILEEQNETDALIANNIIHNANKIGRMKNKELAEMCYCDSATITRFIQKLGFSNYSDFKKWFKDKYHEDTVEVKPYTLDEIMNDHITSLEETRKLMNERDIDQVVNDIYYNDNIVILGGRYSHLVCQDMQMRFLNENKVMTTFIDESEGIQYIKDHANGLLILFSASQSYPIVNDFIISAKQSHYKIIAISHVLNDQIDLTLQIPFNERKWTYNSVDDRYCMLSVVDSIYLKYRQKLHNMQENNSGNML